MPIAVQCGTELVLDRRLLPQAAQTELFQALSFANPKYVIAAKLGRSTDGLDPMVCAWRMVGPDLHLPRGCLRELRTVAANHQLELAIQSSMVPGEQFRCPPLRHRLRDYQQAALQSAIAGGQGLIVIPCGGGKTQVGLGIVQQLQRSAMVFVHTRDLQQQWIERARTLLNVQCGVIGDGQLQLGQLTVATVQSLINWSPRRLAALGSHFGVLICDEVHHSPCATISNLLGFFPARYRIGLTATPERNDGLGPVIGWLFGAIRHRTYIQELVDAGYLMAPEYIQVPTTFTWDGDTSRYFPRLVTDLLRDHDRNQQIIETVRQELSDDGTVLVLTCRRDHCAMLAAALTARGMPTEPLTSQVRPRQRTATLARLRAGRLRCVTATQLADEGLDVPRLTAVVLVGPTKAAGTTIQRIGRTMRPAPGKDVPRVYDFVDRHVGVLAHQADLRRAAFRAECGVPAKRAPKEESDATEE